MSKLSGQRWIAASHLRAAHDAIAKIPVDDAGSDHCNLSEASDYIEAAVGRLGGTLHVNTNEETPE